MPKIVVGRVHGEASLLADLGRAQWAAARLHHVVRDRHSQLDGRRDNDLFGETLGSAIAALRAMAESTDRPEFVRWCDEIGRPANERRNGLVHSIAFTASDREQALRGSTPTRPPRYTSNEILDVADELVAANRSIPDV